MSYALTLPHAQSIYSHFIQNAEMDFRILYKSVNCEYMCTNTHRIQFFFLSSFTYIKCVYVVYFYSIQEVSAQCIRIYICDNKLTRIMKETDK